MNGDEEGQQVRLKDTISDAVRLALVEQRQADHDARIRSLEVFRWWLMTTVAISALSSTGTLLMFILEKHN